MTIRSYSPNARARLASDAAPAAVSISGAAIPRTANIIRAVTLGLALCGAFTGLAGASTACGGAEQRSYLPNQNLVTTLGKDEAKKQLAELLAHAAMPQVSKADIEIADDHYFYKGMDHAWVGGFSTVAKPVTRKIFYGKVTNLEVWQNDDKFYCKLMGIDQDGDEDELDQLRWTTAEEARLFADLVASLKASQGVR